MNGTTHSATRATERTPPKIISAVNSTSTIEIASTPTANCMFSPATGASVALNASAAAVFLEVLSAGRDEGTRFDGADAVTVDEVCRGLAERHGVDLATMTKDVTATLARLAELGVLSVATPAPS